MSKFTRPEGTKICLKCSRDLPRNKDFYHFHFSSSRNKMLMAAYCRQCKKGYMVNYQTEVTRAKAPLEDRIRHENEKLTGEGLRKCIQCQEVKPRDREHFRWDSSGGNFFGKCHECDGNHKFSNSFRSRISHALKGNKRDGRVEELLGCSVPEGRKHIESTWEPGMSWSNHSLRGWHIDHIRPCASFDFSRKEDQSACFSYKNLQALWAKENLKKGAKW